MKKTGLVELTCASYWPVCQNKFALAKALAYRFNWIFNINVGTTYVCVPVTQTQVCLLSNEIFGSKLNKENKRKMYWVTYYIKSPVSYVCYHK